jgi:hypothetical protein
MANLEELYLEGLKRSEIAFNAEREERRKAIEDSLFVNQEDGQWDDDVTEKRRDRPRYTIDRISGAIDQIVGNQRQTRTRGGVDPGPGGTDKGAKIRKGLIRSIERESNASNAYDFAFTEQLTGGYGGWRILFDFEDDDSFDQTILIKPIKSAASSLYFDPSAEEYDKRDALYAFSISSMPIELFKEKYPDAGVTDFGPEIYAQQYESGWFTEDTIRLAEYWYKKPYTRKLGLLSDGRVIDIKEEKAVLDELALMGVEVVRERDVESFNVEMVIMNGAEVLTQPQEWPGKYIPLVPVYGRVATVNDKNYVRGMVRKAKDSQRIYNYATSAAIEATALTPKDPIWITATQAAGHEESLKNHPTKNDPFMLYNSDPTAPGPPSRGGAPQLQTALLEQINQAATDIHATTGIEPASLGNVPEMKSGKAIQAQQAMGDRGSFVFPDNLKKSKLYSYTIILDLLPRVYDGERVVKSIGDDGVAEDVTINQASFDDLNEPIIDEQTGEQILVNDLSEGKYYATVVDGPSSATKREETVTQLTTLAGSSEQLQNLAMDIIVKNMDLNEGEELTARVRKQMIQQGLVEPTEEEVKELGLDQPPPPDPMNEALVQNLAAQTEQLQIGNEKIISEIHNKDADTQSKIIAAQKTSVEALSTLIKSLFEKIQAGAPLSSEDMDLLEGQKALTAETQIDTLEKSELAGSEPLGKPPGLTPAPTQANI